MKKKLIAMLLSAAMCLSLAACGQKADTPDTTDPAEPSGDAATYTVGICQLVQHEALDAATQGFIDALNEALPGQVKIEEKNASGDSNSCATIVNGFVSEGVDLIMANATAALQAAASATSDIPVLGTSITAYGVALDIDDFSGTVGGNVSGTSDLAPLTEQADMILDLFPDAKTVGLLYSKSEDSSKQPIEDAKAYLEGKGIRCVEKTGTTTDEITSAVDALIAEKVDAVFTPTDNTVMTAELAIYEKFLNAKIPQYCGADSFALNGAFVGYGVDYTALGKMTADMVVQVLVDGKSPATLPVATFDNGIAMINTDSCTALGYDLAAVKQAFDGKCSSVLETTTQQNFD